MNRVLIIDRDEIYSEMSRIILEKCGFSVFITNNGNDAIEFFERYEIEIIISELGFNDMDFFELFSKIKKIKEKVLFVIHTEKENTELELRAIREGVYAYQSKLKPYKLFLSRIERLNKKEDIELYVEGYKIDTSRKIAKKKNKEIKMTRLEMDILEYFALNKNKVLSRENILKQVWSTNGSEQYTRVVDTHIKAIRAKLGITTINTIRGIGYELYSNEGKD